jgi:hypothetical protein
VLHSAAPPVVICSDLCCLPLPRCCWEYAVRGMR